MSDNYEHLNSGPSTMRISGVTEADLGQPDNSLLGDLSADDRATIEALLPGTADRKIWAAMALRRGPNVGARFLLDTDAVSAGRHPDSDIFLDDVTVSRTHAVFEIAEQGGYQVRDAGSLNGTYVSRERIGDPVLLANGDEVQIGKFRLVFHAAKS